MKKQRAFTLAEVLITLGIIGVVAALTIPTLIANHRNKVTETKLKKFYSVMNQSIKLAEVENGDAVNWLPQKAESNSRVFENWYLMYLDKNITSTSKYRDTTNSAYYNVAFSDGTGFIAYSPSSAADTTQARAYVFYCLDFKNCEAESYDGKNTFLFTLCSNGKFVASTCMSSTQTRQELLWGCKNADPHKRHSCTALIQHDGWEIKKDYPWRK